MNRRDRCCFGFISKAECKRLNAVIFCLMKYSISIFNTQCLSLCKIKSELTKCSSPEKNGAGCVTKV